MLLTTKYWDPQWLTHDQTGIYTQIQEGGELVESLVAAVMKKASLYDLVLLEEMMMEARKFVVVIKENLKN